MSVDVDSFLIYIRINLSSELCDLKSVILWSCQTVVNKSRSYGRHLKSFTKCSLCTFISCHTQRSLGSQVKPVYRLADRDHTCVAWSSGVSSHQPPVLYSECRCLLSMATTSLSWTDYLTSCLTPEEERKEFASERRKHLDISLFVSPFSCRASREGQAGSFLSITLHNELFIYWIFHCLQGFHWRHCECCGFASIKH